MDGKNQCKKERKKKRDRERGRAGPAALMEMLIRFVQILPRRDCCDLAMLISTLLKTIFRGE